MVALGIGCVIASLVELRLEPCFLIMNGISRRAGYGRYIFTHRAAYLLLTAGVIILSTTSLSRGLAALGGFVVAYNLSFGVFPQPWVPVLRRKSSSMDRLRQVPLLGDPRVRLGGWIAAIIGAIGVWSHNSSQGMLFLAILVGTVLALRLFATMAGPLVYRR